MANKKPTQCIYIHGFNSSPDNSKGDILRRALQQVAPGIKYHLPLVIDPPHVVIETLSNLIQSDPNTFLVGSSLGGFYATYLAEKFNCKAVLINPLITPDVIEDYIGWHFNDYTQKHFYVGMSEVAALKLLEVNKFKNPNHFLLLLKMGDTVCPYQKALHKFPDSPRIIHPGGTHSFDDFGNVLTEVFQFVGLLDG